MDDFVGGKYRGFPEEIGLQSTFCLTLKNKIYEKKKHNSGAPSVRKFGYPSVREI